MGRPKIAKPASQTVAAKLTAEEAAGLALLLEFRAADVRRLTRQKKPSPSGVIRLLIVEALNHHRDEIVRLRAEPPQDMSDDERRQRLAVLQPLIDSGQQSEAEYREWFLVMFGPTNPFV